MRKAKWLSQIKTTLTKDGKKSIELTPAMIQGIKSARELNTDVFINTGDYGYALIRPKSPLVETAEHYDNFENVTIMLLTGIRTYGIEKSIH